MRRKGFTLIELLVVIAIIALLVSILMPSLAKARELAKRAACAMNLSNAAKAMGIYKANNSDTFPWVAGVAAGQSVGANRLTANPVPPAAALARSITANEFVMLRDGDQSEKMFVCPSDNNGKSETDVKDATTGVYRYDFTAETDGFNRTSYGWAAGVTSGANVLNGASDQNTSAILMADMGGEYGVQPDASYAIPTATTTDFKHSMSQNHSSGEYMNFLYVNLSVQNSRTPIVNGDNIYTCSNSTTAGAPYLGTTVSAAWTQHLWTGDSAVTGPKK